MRGILYSLAKRCEVPKRSLFWMMGNRIWSFWMIHYGKMVYKKLCRRFPQKILLYSPTASIGDLCCFHRVLPEFLKAEGEQNYVLLCSKNTAHAAHALEFEQWEIITRGEQCALCLMKLFCGDWAGRLKNFYTWEFFDAEYLLREPLGNSPSDYFNENAVAEIFRRYRLNKGRTIMIAPYEQTVTALSCVKLSTEFWIYLAEELMRRGFSVCTNCDGTKEQPAIVGTVSVHVPLDNFRAVISMMGYLVAVRSGIVDFLFPCDDIYQVILYPDEHYLKKYGFSKIRKSKKMLEIIYGDYKGREKILADRIADLVTKTGRMK